MRRILFRIRIVLLVLAVLVTAGYFVLFPPYEPLAPTGSYSWTSEIRGYDTGLPETYVSDGSTRMLNIYTDSSYSKLAELPQYRQNAYYLDSEREDVKTVYLPGCGHFSITDLALSSPILTRVLNGIPGDANRVDTLRAVSAECLSFLDTWVKGDVPLE